jgi:DNA-binding transcriptional regulator YhcF (GntR family)
MHPELWTTGRLSMDEYWATRTGRWRRALRSQHAPSIADRLYDVIHADIAAGALPAGALLPSAERVAQELTIEQAAVEAAYARLLAEAHLDSRDNGALAIASRDGNAQQVGDATQIRFEAALLRAVREAAARGMSTHEATGIFKATMRRESKI